MLQGWSRYRRRCFQEDNCSPVDEPRFLDAIRHAFRLNKEDRRITLSQISFACVAIIRDHSDCDTSPTPGFFQVFPKGFGARIELEEYRDMHGVMCASLAAKLNTEATPTPWVGEQRSLTSITSGEGCGSLLVSQKSSAREKFEL